ncbi:MAG: FAD-dependent oxidoreductase [Chloroflexota bacterium]|nr:FAD-dependent oxidoreductase [Chloroflexota bacterium]
MYELIIIGGGPAGISAATMALNQRIEALIVAEQWGGQTTYEMQLEDKEGRGSISGETLLDSFRRQLDYLDFVRHFDRVTEVTPKDDTFVVETIDGDRFEGQTLIVATGAKPERLNVPGARRLEGRGLGYCATTHAGLFLGKSVAVIGNGRRAQWAAASLSRKAHEVHLLAPEPLVPTPLADKLRRMDNLRIVEGAIVKEVLGDRFVSGVVAVMPDGEEREIELKGIFVKLTRLPNSGLVKDWVDCDSRGHVIVDQHNATSWPGVFAAGDVTLISEQVLVHVGEGVKAALSAYHYLLMS